MSFEALEDRVATLERSHAQLRADLDANTQMTASVKADTNSIVEFTNAMRGFATFCRWTGKGLKWLGLYISPLVLAGIAFWTVLKGQKTP